jgi:CBS domain-containing protein
MRPVDGPRKPRLVVAPATSVSSLGSFFQPVVLAALGESVATVARRLRDQRVGCVVVAREGRPVGILTDRDVVLRVVAEGLPGTAPIDDVLTYDPITLSSDETVEAAVQRMREHGVRRIPIVDGAGLVVGIVTLDELLARLGSELAAVGEVLRGASDASDSR